MQGRSGVFFRRILLLAVLFAVSLCILGARLFTMQVVNGEFHSARAESRNRRESWLPMVRGRILDREGRVLAEDRPAWDVALFYSFLTGEWEAVRARTLSRDAVGGRAALAKLSSDERARVNATSARRASEEVEQIFAEVAAAGGIDRMELESRIAAIRDRVSSVAESVKRRRAQKGHDASEPIAEETRAHVIAANIAGEKAFALRKLADQWPGAIEVQDVGMRVHHHGALEVTLSSRGLPGRLEQRADLRIPLQSVGELVIGSVRRETWASDIARRPFWITDANGVKTADPGGYREGPDQVGSRGIEFAWEDALRGERGRLVRHLDSGEDDRIEPRAGRDIQLTLDIMLQARVEAILKPQYGLTLSGREFHSAIEGLPSGTELNAAVAVVAVATGEILALASEPGPGDIDRLSDDEERDRAPFIHRAIDAAYAPGSIVKPLMYVAAVSAGESGASDAVVCTGHYFEGNESLARCWIYRQRNNFATHGSLEPREALARSCNMYFFEMANRLGGAGVVDWYRNWGAGARLHTGMEGTVMVDENVSRRIGESAGSLPTRDEMIALERSGEVFSTVILGIGQGPITWSPLHAANAMATLARGGKIRDATIVKNEQVAGHRSSGSLQLNEQAVEAALEGMRLAVETSVGTGHHLDTSLGREPIFDIPNVLVRGKTGTAQAGAWTIDADGDGIAERTITGADHAWYVCLVANRDDGIPLYVISVLLEHGGSGGKAAGPIAAAVARALIAEGYLRGGGDERPKRTALIDQSAPEADE
ncbi:MAG: penicillin-binding transpeptidase domain-containing protein [Planctomycetota bacterium]|nr:penicillin-binding transpeptidase domain-containing protein [Planctomycetota bacterium]